MAENTNPSWEDQKKTYTNFIGMVKWGIISCAVLVVFLYVVIQP